MAVYQVYCLDDINGSVREYKRRNYHNKTKDGCLACKTRRVKCDEIKPICRRCERNSRPCSFSADPHLRGLMRRRYHCSATSLPLVASSSSLTATTSPLQAFGYGGVTHDILLAHLQHQWFDMFSVPFRPDVIDIAVDYPVVSFAILALTACHLRHKTPCSTEYRVAEHHHQILALKQYQQALTVPLREALQADADALLLSGFFLSVLAFALPHTTNRGEELPDVVKSWPFTDDANSLGWLALQAGLRPLVLASSPYLDQSMRSVSAMFLGDHKYSQHPPVLRAPVPELWQKVFSIDDAGGEIYRLLVKTLAELKELDPLHTSAFLMLVFLAKLTPEIRALLSAKDLKAVWLLGYWLGLMCRFKGVWWCEQRVNRDFKAVSLWLGQQRVVDEFGDEDLVWEEMVAELVRTPEIPVAIQG